MTILDAIGDEITTLHGAIALVRWGAALSIWGVAQYWPKAPNSKRFMLLTGGLVLVFTLIVARLLPAPHQPLPMQGSLTIAIANQHPHITNSMPLGTTLAAVNKPAEDAGQLIVQTIGVGITLLPWLFIARLALIGLALTYGRLSSHRAHEAIQRLSRYPVYLSSTIPTPFASCWLGKSITLPRDLLFTNHDDILTILRHEEAHLDARHPGWLIFAEIVCTCDFDNPFAWLLRHSLRREAEKAADDSVLLLGVDSVAYAGVLLRHARALGRLPIGLFSNTFSGASGLRARIQNILDSGVNRITMNRLQRTTATMISLCLGIGLAFASLPWTARRSPIALQEPTSPYPDVAAGLTTAARPDNHWTGTLADGRKMQVVQVSRVMPDHSIVTWGPDGTRLLASQRIPFHYAKVGAPTECRFIVLRYQENEIPRGDVNGGLGSGPRNRKGANGLTFAGGNVLSRKDGWQYLVTYIEATGMGEIVENFTFGVASKQFTDEGIVSTKSPIFKSVRIQEVNAPLTSDATHPIFRGKKGPFAMIEFTLNHEKPRGDWQFRPRLASTGTFEKKAPVTGSFGSGYRASGEYHGRVYYLRPLKTAKEFHLFTRSSAACEVYDLHLTPK